MTMKFKALRTRRQLAVAAALASVVLAAACSSSSSGNSNPGSSGSASGSPIDVNQIASIQSTLLSAPEMQSSAQAAVDQVNATGGVNGHKLVLTTCNDQADPNQAIKCAQGAVQNSSVVSLVGTLTLYGAQVNPLLQAGKLPNVGPDPINPSDAQSPMNFLMDDGLPGIVAMPGIAKKYLHASKVAFFNLESPDAAASVPMIMDGAQLAGGVQVKQILIPDTATDYTQYVAQAQQWGATVIISTFATQQNLTLFKAIQSSKSGIHTIMAAGGVSQQLMQEAGAAAVAGDYVVDGVPETNDSNPTGTAYLASMAKYQPQEKVFDALGMRAWASVMLFAKVAATINGPITRASVLAAFNKVHDLTFMFDPSLSFDQTGPLSQYPRLVTRQVFPSLLTGAKYTPLPAYNPFAG